MAVGNVMNGLKRKMERFLYGDEEVQPRNVQQNQGYAPAPDAAFSQPAPQYAPVQANYYQPPVQQAPQQPMYQPPVQQAPQQPMYQPPVQQAPQQQPAYQQPAQQPQQASQQHGWNNRFGQKQEKVVNIRDYQQPAPETAPPAEEAKPMGQATTRVVCARGMMDCRLAITLLRAGDAVLVTMENVKEQAEMRRLVDTLSGACYSLSASITKVSRHGVYLLAPQTMLVYADQLINQMNTAAPKPQRPMYQPGQRAGYAGQMPYQQPVQQAQQPAYAPRQEAYQQPQANPYQQQPQQSAFTQRTAAPQENIGAFYARPQQQQAPQMPAFSSQSANAGYAPDELEVAE